MKILLDINIMNKYLVKKNKSKFIKELKFKID